MYGFPITKAPLNRGHAFVYPGGTVAPPLYWNPSYLGNAVITWWDYSDTSKSSHWVDGTHFFLLLDKSGEGNTLESNYLGDTSVLPTIQTINSLEAAGFDGSSTLVSGASWPLVNTQPYTIAQFFQTGASQNSNSTVFDGSTDQTGNRLQILTQNNGGNAAVYAGTMVDTGVKMNNNSPYVMVSYFNNSNSAVSINGNSITTANTGTYAITGGPSI